MPFGRRASRSLQRLFDVSRHLVVRVLSSSPESLDERIVGPCIDIVGCEDGRITAGRLDFGLQPFEILPGVGGIGKGIHRLLQWNRADLLQPPPGVTLRFDGCDGS